MSKREPVMTEGEKMIWAAVFAARYDIRDPGAHGVNVMDSERWEEWESEQLYAVEALRKEANEIGHPDNWPMVNTMLATPARTRKTKGGKKK